jgi:hypothetical protein
LCAALAVPCFAGAVHLTADLSADFLEGTSGQSVFTTFSQGTQPLLWGVGWEIILGRLGVGGNYDVSFRQDAHAGWWLDWIAPGIFMSFHPLGGNSWIDPFVEVGAGCAGRVNLSTDADVMDANENLYLSLFPFAAAGLSLNLDGLLISAKASYTPYNAPIPVTTIGLYPLGQFQIALSGGIAIAW